MTESFKQRIDNALHNDQARANFRFGMTRLMDMRAESFPDDNDLQQRRQNANSLKNNSLRQLPDLLQQLEQQLNKNGIQLHWAETAEQANRTVASILKSNNVSKVVKGKSMVTEEIEMNEYLEQQGIRAIESDLGEFIIQLNGEKPSHIVAPAVHKNRQQVSELFVKHIKGAQYTKDIEQLTAIAREELRHHFKTAGAGISGANFLVAETGTICLIENEGNGRMCTTVPPIHIAVTGIEKVIEKFSDLPALLDVLTKSATGQPITSYVNLISSARKDDELDGPQQVHVVLLDNGRSNIQRHEVLIDTLKCIRCGACINHCPVFVQVGGHAYGTTYPGPIGIVLEPQKQGMQLAGDLLSACTLCGRCGEVCPVKIPLPDLISQLRHESVSGVNNNETSIVKGQGVLKKWPEVIIWKIWSLLHSHGFLYRLMTAAVTSLRFLMPRKLGGWTRYRSTPKVAARSLHQRVKIRQEIADE